MEQNNTINPPLDSFVEQSKDTKNQGIKQPETNLSFNDLEDEFSNLEEQFNSKNNVTGVLKVQSANQWIKESKKRPTPMMLFDEFWYQGEICILFADSNVGKSLLSVQIGNSISKGEAIKGFKLEAEAQPVIYLDFELSDKQFENRYSNDYKDHYIFSEQFQRAEIDSDLDLTDDAAFEECLFDSLTQIIETEKAKVIIIDNLTYLKNETEKAKNASPLMKRLKALKTKYNLSILVLAHTPKRDRYKPISNNDVQGSKMLMNFCDSCFAIGASAKDTSLRYFKQIKVRNSEHLYNTDNVVITQIEKISNFLGFKFLSYGCEMEHLKQLTQTEKGKLDQDIIDLKSKMPSLSNRKIATQLGTNHMRVKRVLERNQKDNGT